MFMLLQKQNFVSIMKFDAMMKRMTSVFLSPLLSRQTKQEREECQRYTEFGDEKGKIRIYEVIIVYYYYCRIVLLPG